MSALDDTGVGGQEGWVIVRLVSVEEGRSVGAIIGVVVEAQT